MFHPRQGMSTYVHKIAGELEQNRDEIRSQGEGLWWDRWGGVKCGGETGSQDGLLLGDRDQGRGRWDVGQRVPGSALWATDGGNALGCPSEPEITFQRSRLLPYGSRVWAHGLPPQGPLWFPCPSVLPRFPPTSLSGSVYGGSPASWALCMQGKALP